MNDSISFDLVIRDAKPFQGYMYILFTSSQGTYTSMRVNINLNIKKPILVLKPNLIRVDVMPGSIKIVDVIITNVGEVSARNVSVSLPTDSRFSLVSFTVEKHKLTDSNYTDILSKDTALLSIAIVIGGSDSLGEISGNIYINSLSTSSRLPFTVYISSTETTNVTFTVKDEYTYFAIGSPLVTNATITLSNPRREFLEARTTENETGVVIFENVYEDQYTIFVEAENHSSYGAVIFISPSKSHHEIFLPRIAVKYTWTVEATTFKDVYTIALESTFETYVPMPVVTVQPSHIDTLPLEQKETSEIEFTITNHGLVQANNVRFAFPTSHPYLTFTSMVEMIGIIAANTSIVVPVKTMRNQREERSGSFCVDVFLIYDYQCPDRQTRSALIRLIRGNSEPSCGRMNSTGRPSYGTYGTYGTLMSVGYVGTSTLTCDCLSTLIENCILSFHPAAGCAIAGKNWNSETPVTVIVVSDTVMGCIVSRINPLISTLYNAARCVMDVNEKCSSGRKRREINSDILTALIKSSGPIINFLNMGQEIFGTRYITLEDTWYTEFKRGAADDTQLGAMISETEYSAIIDNLSEIEKKGNVSRFIQRFNNTVAAWENGTLSQLEDSGQVISFRRLQAGIDQFHYDNDKSKALGYDSVFDEYGQLVKSYREAKEQESSSEARKKEGVCARVRIRIEQELVLTRDAFKAKLEIENGEKFDLENIKVEIKITQPFGSEELQNEKFSIGKLTLIGISGIGGEGRLGLGLSGSAEWLIVPYSTAAPEDDTEYDIGGQLSYSVDGTELSVSLLPDTITVSPNPSLVVHYFHEKFVRGDDALTPEIEPIVPFTLAVMVMNSGYGVAKALKLTSGQPEIIENEKGLLVSFRIIAAQLGNQAITPSLSVDFGDIHSLETKTARWLMTSSLMGKFFNYSATFENINPLGDPQLSLIDRLEYHDLVHLVRIQFSDADDGLDDFLVNSFPDQDSFPDMLYDSANGSSVSQVSKANVTDIKWKTYTNPSMKVYKQVNLTVSVKEVMWFYARIENTFTRQLSTSEELLNVVTQSGRIILLEKNVWQTTHIFDKFFLHLFDFVQSENEDEDLNGKEIIYLLTYGPKNNNAPHISASSYNVNMTNAIKVGSNIVHVTAYDNDDDNVMFELKNNSDNLFAIQQITLDSVAVVLNARIISTGTFVVELVVKDDGIPTRSSSINIHISITEEGIDGNSTRRTSPLTTETPMSTKPSDPSNLTDVQKENTTTSLEAYDDTDDTFPLFIPLTIGGIIILLVMVTAGIVYFFRRKRTDSGSNTFELDSSSI
ncbi:uncharacterized protein LOC132725880 [Ruditapes philippinarum]|uniref:uncharacterized protein LOC132725880 n=1 Tax=Ruditapes philippinarum TaxID=129788 RepID=UPI00295BB805|nr:uncharacterized protein LOC132725880 [Ruditapes philippinarum]